jgi:hypothetical protein
MLYFLTADLYGGKTGNDNTAMRREITLSRRWPSSDQHGSRTLHDRIRRSCTGEKIAHDGSRLIPDQYGCDTRAGNRATNVGNGTGYHGAGM